MAENRILSLLTLMTRRQPTIIIIIEDVVDAMKRAVDAVDAFTREW